MDTVMALSFLLLGVRLGLFYEAVALIRRLICKKISGFIADVLVMLVISAAVYLYFCGYTYGKIRVLPLLCAAAGFLTVHFTVGTLCSLLYARVLRRLIAEIKKNFVKCEVSLKNLLKKISEMLYNIFKKREREVVKNARSKKRKTKKAPEPE